ncbi:serine hydrolase [Neptunicella marina]|uniref:Serine hydrolase n=1 Tax=Neptunicella marina TaxID=2125989 RepID=A0A8J6ISI8_9ALTE|nr:serine hydrolase [Neptunicella marina]MBC3765619.1 serine hydrolase [Neptunicella marina]
MKRFLTFRHVTHTLCALIGLVSVSVSAQQQSAESEPLPGLESFMDGLMNAQLKSSHIAGGTVSIVKDGKVLLAKGYGLADVEKRKPVSGEHTLFRPGSTSKLFTYTAVMQLVEQGKINLDDDANKYLTQFQIPATYEKPVTVRDLLTHTAGFEERFINMIVFDKKELEPMADFLKHSLPDRVRPAGKNSSYSNHAVAIAGLIVANVSGESFYDYVENHIFKPLGMNSSSFREPLPANLIDDMSVGYAWDEASQSYIGQKFEMVSKLAPAGSSSSTAADMAKFMLAHLNDGSYNGAQILSPDTTNLMHSKLYSKGYGGNAMAYGFYETSYKGLRMVGHGGDLIYFHSDMYLLPEKGFGIFMSFNTADTGDTRNIVITSVLDEYFTDKNVVPPVSPESFKQDVANYVGEYQFMRHSSSDVTKVAGILGGTLKVTAGDNNTLLISPLGGKFAQVNDNLFETVDFASPDFSKVTFQLDENGVADEIYLLPFMHAKKLGFLESSSTHQLLLALLLIGYISLFVSVYRQRKQHAGLPSQQRLLPRMLLVVGVINTLFIILFALAFALNYPTLFAKSAGAFMLIPLSLTLMLVGLVATVSLVYSTYLAWANGFWSVKRRVSYSLLTVLTLLFILLAYYYNLIGYHY